MALQIADESALPNRWKCAESTVMQETQFDLVQHRLGGASLYKHPVLAAQGLTNITV
jgi:hypothetical protein